MKHVLFFTMAILSLSIVGCQSDSALEPITVTGGHPDATATPDASATLDLKRPGIVSLAGTVPCLDHAGCTDQIRGGMKYTLTESLPGRGVLTYSFFASAKIFCYTTEQFQGNHRGTIFIPKGGELPSELLIKYRVISTINFNHIREMWVTYTVSRRDVRLVSMQLVDVEEDS